MRDVVLVIVISVLVLLVCVFFFQAEDGIRDLVRSRGLGDVYKRQGHQGAALPVASGRAAAAQRPAHRRAQRANGRPTRCLLYTSDAADERSSVDLGGRRIIKKKKHERCGRSHIQTEKQDEDT